MHSLAVKIISLASLFILTFLAGIIPLKLRRKGLTISASDFDHNREQSQDLRRKMLISLSTCFAGGAFFASSMLELLPIVEREFDDVLKQANITTDFPIAEFAISIGFFIILTVEQMIQVMKERPVRSHADINYSLIGKEEKGSEKSGYGSTDFHPNIIKEPESGESDCDEGNDHLHHHSHGGDLDQIPAEHHVSSCTYAAKSHNAHGHGHGFEESSGHHDHSKKFINTNTKHENQRHYLRSYLLLIALSIHALFEGLAVGLFQNVDSMVELLGALIIHKCILAFSIGINLVQHSFPVFMVIKSSFLFSAMSPVGLGLGILMLKCTSASLGHILSAIFQAIATGTFLYVTFFEIFFHELKSRECHKLLKVLMMILGFSVVAVVQYFDTKVSSN